MFNTTAYFNNAAYTRLSFADRDFFNPQVLAEEPPYPSGWVPIEEVADLDAGTEELSREEENRAIERFLSRFAAGIMQIKPTGNPAFDAFVETLRTGLSLRNASVRRALHGMLVDLSNGIALVLESQADPGKVFSALPDRLKHFERYFGEEYRFDQFRAWEMVKKLYFGVYAPLVELTGKKPG